MKTFYLLEVGVKVGRKEFYDENVIFFDDIIKAHNYGLEYVQEGVDKTYYMIKKQEWKDDFYVANNGLIYEVDNTPEDSYDVEWDYSGDVVEAFIKLNGKIKDCNEDFIKRNVDFK